MISSTVDTEFTIGQLVRMAYRRAGLLNVELEPNNAQAAAARDELQTIVKGLSRRGIYANAIVFENVTLTPGVDGYFMSTGVEQVFGDAMLLPEGAPPTGADGETILRQVQAQEWHTTGSKQAEGRPQRYYVDRSQRTARVVVWPRPDAPYIVRFRVQRRLSDVRDANATVDLQEYWYDHLVWELAARLARYHGLPPGQIQDLASESEAAFKQARRHANPHPPTHAAVTHRTSWSR